MLANNAEIVDVARPTAQRDRNSQDRSRSVQVGPFCRLTGISNYVPHYFIHSGMWALYRKNQE